MCDLYFEQSYLEPTTIICIQGDLQPELFGPVLTYIHSESPGLFFSAQNRFMQNSAILANILSNLKVQWNFRVQMSRKITLLWIYFTWFQFNERLFFKERNLFPKGIHFFPLRKVHGATRNIFFFFLNNIKQNEISKIKFNKILV